MARILGTDGNDTLTGWTPPGRTHKADAESDPDPWIARQDLIDAKAGDDSVSGGMGNDRVLAGAGRDEVAGGNGHDTILPAGGAPLLRVESNVIDGGGGKDWVSYEDERYESVILALDGSFSYDRMSNVENLRGGGAGDRLVGDGGRNRLDGLGGRDTLFGGAGADTLQGGDEGALGDDLYGGAGNDSLFGGRGLDHLDGGDGADALDGSDGADVVVGGRGNDTIRGGRDADSLIGGKGEDVFVYALASEAGDVVLDFSGRHDQLLILAAGFGGGLVAGQDLLATGAYIEAVDGLATSASGVGQFIYDRQAGALRWDADGAGGSDAILLVELVDPSHWTGASLIIG